MKKSFAFKMSSCSVNEKEDSDSSSRLWFGFSYWPITRICCATQASKMLRKFFLQKIWLSPYINTRINKGDALRSLRSLRAQLNDRAYENLGRAGKYKARFRPREQILSKIKTARTKFVTARKKSEIVGFKNKGSICVLWQYYI